jgi:dienelactone hydrolase
MYVAYPPDKKTDNAILYLSDVFGLPLVQNKLWVKHAIKKSTHEERLADSFAKAGYLVVEPDYFEGDAAPTDMTTPGFDFIKFFTDHPPEKIDSIIEKTIKHMRNDLGVKRIGTAGYCFGGKYVGRFLAKGKGVDVGFTAHPALLEQSEISGISGPLSLATAGESESMTKPRQLIQIRNGSLFERGWKTPSRDASG